MALTTETKLRAMVAAGIPNPFPMQQGDLLTPAAKDFLQSQGISIVINDRKTVSFSSRRSSLREIPVGVSNRHVHLSEQHIEQLFGTGFQLQSLRELSQKGQFAAEEKVTLVGPKGVIQGVRILGPARGETQVEISRTDSFTLGVQAPLRLSGNIENSCGITLVGSKGSLMIKQGVIVAKNHVHMSEIDAKQFDVKQGDRLILQTTGDRPILFADVIVRVNPRFSLDFHVDTDEANASFLKTGDTVRLIEKK